MLYYCKKLHFTLNLLQIESNGRDGSHRSQCPRFVLFPLDTNEERIPFSYSQLKTSYSNSRLAMREPRQFLFLDVAVAMSCQ